MTELLISVRDQFEAASVGQFEPGIIDFKHPERGPLGALDRSTVKKILMTVGDSCLKSIALGELSDWIGIDAKSAEMDLSSRIADQEKIVPSTECELLRHIQFVKVGLSKLFGVNDWQVHWLELMNSMPPTACPVGVVYVDGVAAGCPSPEAVIELLTEIPTAALLLDTFNKSSGTLLSILNPNRIRELVNRCHDLDFQIALAGSIQQSDLNELVGCGPDFIGVRGAICSERRARLNPTRLAEFVSAFDAARSTRRR